MNVILAADKGYDIIVGGGRYTDLDSGKVHYVLSILNASTREHVQIPLSFLPHGIAVDPNAPQRLVVCEKIGPGAALVDISEMVLLESIETTPERWFYGHCAFSPDGRYFYTTETYRESRDGVIVVRESSSKKIVGEFPSHGQSPHECHLIDDGKTMVVTNGGGDLAGKKPNISYIDMQSHELIRQECLTNRHINAGHSMLADDGSLIVVSAPRSGLSPEKLGGVSIQPQGKLMRSISSPKKVISAMKGEALSVITHQDTALVTHPTGDMVTFWSMSQRKFLKKIELPGPRGVSLVNNNQQFIVSYGPKAAVVLIDTHTLELNHASAYTGTYLAGSHLYNWSSLVTSLSVVG